jgi:hypothetical protein
MEVRWGENYVAAEVRQLGHEGLSTVNKRVFASEVRQATDYQQVFRTMSAAQTALSSIAAFR